MFDLGPRLSVLLAIKKSSDTTSSMTTSTKLFQAWTIKASLVRKWTAFFSSACDKKTRQIPHCICYRYRNSKIVVIPLHPKVQLVWEGHKNLEKSSSRFWHSLVTSKPWVQLYQIFVAFLEKLNFTGLRLRASLSLPDGHF